MRMRHLKHLISARISYLAANTCMLKGIPCPEFEIPRSCPESGPVELPQNRVIQVKAGLKRPENAGRALDGRLQRLNYTKGTGLRNSECVEGRALTKRYAWRGCLSRPLHLTRSSCWSENLSTNGHLGDSRWKQGPRQTGPRLETSITQSSQGV